MVNLHLHHFKLEVVFKDGHDLLYNNSNVNFKLTLIESDHWNYAVLYRKLITTCIFKAACR